MKRLLAWALVLTMALGLLAGCADGGQGAGDKETPAEDQKSVPVLTGLTYKEDLELQYAQCFKVHKYEEGHALIQIDDGRSYLVVPEGGVLPPEAENYIVIQKPLDNIYLVANSAMALFRSIDGIDAIRLSGTRSESWYIPEAVEAMERGDILYSGKYNEPDLELILSESCDLAVESTMILHSPKTLEKLEELGIPVLVDRSSYETHPLGRTEWMKLYGVLVDREEEAAAAFREQTEVLEQLSSLENTGKTVAIFFVNSRGNVSVRKSSDYLAKMIELAGGKYIFEDLGADEKAASSMNMTMEDFYAGARDADYIIYNATIGQPLESIDQLIEKSELFTNFKAVKEGNVWCTGRDLYQATDVLGGIIQDIHAMLTGDGDEEGLTFFRKVE